MKNNKIYKVHIIHNWGREVYVFENCNKEKAMELAAEAAKKEARDWKSTAEIFVTWAEKKDNCSIYGCLCQNGQHTKLGMGMPWRFVD